MPTAFDSKIDSTHTVHYRAAGLAPGDILLFSKSRSEARGLGTGSAAARWGQAKFFGDDESTPDLTHSVIWIQGSPGVTGDVEVAEASGSAGLRLGPLRPGFYAWFRMTLSQRELAGGAAIAAQFWGSGGDSYSKLTAFSTNFSSAASSAAAPGRATALAAAYSDSLLGKNDGTVAPNNWGSAICSEFVIGCFQAASILRREPLRGMTALNASSANVRDLQRALINDDRFMYMMNVVSTT